MPDGSPHEFASDEIATQAMNAWNQQFPTLSTVSTKPVEQSFLGKMFSGIAEPVAQMATGTIAKPVSELAGLGAIPLHAAGLINTEPSELQRYLQEGGTYKPSTQAGMSPDNPINWAANKLGQGIEAIRPSAATDASSIGGIAQNALREAVPQAIGLAGMKLGDYLGVAAKESNIAKMGRLQEEKANMAGRNAIREEGAKLGLIAEAEGKIKEPLSNIGGANPHVSFKNRSIMSNALTDEVGLGKGAKTDLDVTNRISELGQKYTNVENALGQSVTFTPTFMQDVGSLVNEMKRKVAANPSVFGGLTDSIDSLDSQLLLKNMNPGDLMDSIRQLRENARLVNKNPNKSIMDTASAETNSKLANMYEDLIEQKLGNKSAALNEFRNAREQLAKIHLYDEARMTDGLIDPQKFASVVGKYAGKKKYTSGNFETVAKFANTFPKVSQATTKAMMPSAGRFELMMGLGGMAAAPSTGGASLLATIPMAARSIAPVLGEYGVLAGKSPSYGMPIVRQMAPPIAQAGMLSSTTTPYISQEQP